MKKYKDNSFYTYMRRRHQRYRKRRKRWSRSGFPGLRNNVPYPDPYPYFNVKENIMNWRLMYKNRTYIKSNLPIVETFKKCDKITKLIKENIGYSKFDQLIYKYDPIIELYNNFKRRDRDIVKVGVDISKILDRARDTYISGKMIGLLSDEQMLPNMKSFDQSTDPVNYYYSNSPSSTNLHTGSLSEYNLQLIADKVVDVLENRTQLTLKLEKIMGDIDKSNESFENFIKEYTKNEEGFGTFTTAVLSNFKSLIDRDVKTTDIKKAYKDIKPTEDEKLISLLDDIKNALSKLNIRFDDTFGKNAEIELVEMVKESKVNTETIAAQLKKRNESISGSLGKLSADIQGVQGGIGGLIQKLNTKSTYEVEATSRYNNVLSKLGEIIAIIKNQQHTESYKPSLFSPEKRTTYDTDILNVLNGIINTLTRKDVSKQKEYTDLMDEFLNQFTEHVKDNNERTKKFLRFVFDKNKDFREEIKEHNKEIIDKLVSEFEYLTKSIKKTNDIIKENGYTPEVDKFLIEMNTGIRTLPTFLNDIINSMDKYLEVNVLGQEIMEDILKEYNLDLQEIIDQKLNSISSQCLRNISTIKDLIRELYNTKEKNEVKVVLVKLSFIIDKVIESDEKLDTIKNHKFKTIYYETMRNGIKPIIEHIKLIKKTHMTYEMKELYEDGELELQQERRRENETFNISDVLQRSGKKRKQPTKYLQTDESMVENIRNMASNFLGGITDAASGFLNFYKSYREPKKGIYENMNIPVEDNTYVEENLEYTSMDVESEPSLIDFEPSDPSAPAGGILSLNISDLNTLFKNIGIITSDKRQTRSDITSKLHTSLMGIYNEYTKKKKQNEIKKMSKDVGFLKKIIACGYLDEGKLMNELVINYIKTIICNVSITKDDLKRQQQFMNLIGYKGYKDYTSHYYYPCKACVLSERMKGKKSFKDVLKAFEWGGYITLNSENFTKKNFKEVVENFIENLSNSLHDLRGKENTNINVIIDRASIFKTFLEKIKDIAADTMISRVHDERYRSFINNMDEKDEFKNAMESLTKGISDLLLTYKHDMRTNQSGDKIILPKKYPRILLMGTLCAFGIINLDDFRQKDSDTYFKLVEELKKQLEIKKLDDEMNLDVEINRKKIHLDYSICRHIYTKFEGGGDLNIVSKVTNVMQNLFILLHE